MQRSRERNLVRGVDEAVVGMVPEVGGGEEGSGFAAARIRVFAGYPFKPVVAMPSTRYFCSVMNMSTTGSMDRVDMANMAP